MLGVHGLQQFDFLTKGLELTLDIEAGAALMLNLHLSLPSAKTGEEPAWLEI